MRDCCLRTFIKFSVINPLQVIVMGAEQSALPKDYQEKLRAVKTNMYKGPLPMMSELERARRKANETANHCCDA